MFRHTALTAALLGAVTCPLVAAETTTGPSTSPTQTGDEANTTGKPFLGVIVRPTAEADFDGASGLVIRRVFPRTTATALGLQAKDVLLDCNDTEVASRNDLKQVLEQIAVGDEISVRFQRGEETISAVTTMQARPTRKGLEHEVREAREAVTELQREHAAQRAELEVDRAREETDLAEAMQELSDTLSTLPERLDTAARQFKAVYPDGEFTVDIVIRITSDADSADAIDLSPPVPDPTTPGTDEPENGTPTTETKETGTEGEQPSDPDAGVVPPPTR